MAISFQKNPMAIENKFPNSPFDIIYSLRPTNKRIYLTSMIHV